MEQNSKEEQCDGGTVHYCNNKCCRVVDQVQPLLCRPLIVNTVKDTLLVNTTVHVFGVRFIHDQVQCWFISLKGKDVLIESSISLVLFSLVENIFLYYQQHKFEYNKVRLQAHNIY